MSLADRIIGVESGGNPNAQNPNSSAGGLGQFIDSTWLSMLAQNRPDIKGTPEQLLALKSDPGLSRQMTEAYAAQNGQILSQAGLPVNPGTQYLAHFAGPQGAIKVLGADPAAPVADILGTAVVDANPFLKGMTAADLQAWASRKMGGAPQQQPQQVAQASPAGQSMPPPAPQSPRLPTSQPQAAPQQAGAFFGQMPAEQASPLPPIFAPTRRPVDISKLRAALEAAGNRGPILRR